MSRFPSWHFRTMDPGEMHVDPVHDEFFKMQDLADALVREAIQNSLDARRTRGPVRVRFRFGVGAEALSAEAAQEYFVGLREHIDAVSADLHSFIPREDEPVPYLLVEDFGTRGLTGDPSIDPELEHEGSTRNDFYYFWRNVGRSKKGEEDRGRWGLGKAVFPVASRIRTIFGLTRRADDERSLLLGQSVLRTHVVGDRRIYPYGFFARFGRRNGMPLPIEDPILLERFADDFRLDRKEPGLSVVIPYYRGGEDELSFDRIIRSAIVQYFYPITRGDLTVRVEESGRAVSIDSKTIEEVATAWCGDAAEAVSRLTQLTRWSLGDAARDRIELALPRADRAPSWKEPKIDDARLSDLRERFDRGERIAIRVPVHVKRKKSRAAVSWFDVVLERDPMLRKPEVHFIRRGITIPEVRTGNLPQTPFRVLIVIDHDVLSTFLGDAENPSHSDWSERQDRLRTTYDGHGGTMRYVKQSPGALAALLTRPPEGRVQDFLGDLFSVAMPGAAAEERGGTAKRANAGEGESRPGPANVPATASVPGMSITRLAGGFAITGTGRQTGDGRTLIVELAYRARSGNPFRKHSPFDFDLGGDGIAIEAEGATAEPIAPNRIALRPQSPKFQLTLKGFDVRRDLLVHVFKRDDAAETELH